MEFEYAIVVVYLLGLVVVVVGLFFIPFFLWELPLVPTEADPEVVNGILTVSGIIFGFQFAFFKPPTVLKLRSLWVIALIIQICAIAWVAFDYVNDTLNYGFLSLNTLQRAYFTFATIVLATVLMASTDYFVHLFQAQKKVYV